MNKYARKYVGLILRSLYVDNSMSAWRLRLKLNKRNSYVKKSFKDRTLHLREREERLLKSVQSYSLKLSEKDRQVVIKTLVDKGVFNNCGTMGLWTLKAIT